MEICLGIQISLEFCFEVQFLNSNHKSMIQYWGLWFRHLKYDILCPFFFCLRYKISSVTFNLSYIQHKQPSIPKWATRMLQTVWGEVMTFELIAAWLTRERREEMLSLPWWQRGNCRGAENGGLCRGAENAQFGTEEQRQFFGQLGHGQSCWRVNENWSLYPFV